MVSMVDLSVTYELKQLNKLYYGGVVIVGVDNKINGALP